ncbi:MAG: hypothetical protein FJ104_00755 [Deltaproteobacteria bacterium]|nr:hypothetical protein [Deltaproteobacteria bacterium]
MDASDASPGDGGGMDGGGGDAGPSFGVPSVVGAYGCFVQSGDGGDLLDDGRSAPTLTSSPYGAPCGASSWVSDNQFAHAPMTPPTVISMRRSFILQQAVAAGDVTLSVKADDAAEIVVNGQLVGGCTPPGGSPGACQAGCQVVTFPGTVLRPQGQLNTVEVRLVNLQSNAIGSGNYGYTAISYTICVNAPE